MSDLANFFNSEFMPHGHCYLWTPSILWTNVISDLFIAASYFSIPVILFYIVRQRPDWRFRPVFFLFCAFIFWCGVTHVMGIITIWHGVYGLQGILKAITAGVSFSTAIVMLRLSPEIRRIPSISEINEANRQISEEKFNNAMLRAESETLKLLQVSLEAAPVALLSMNDNGSIQLTNRQLETLLGYDKDELLYMDASLLLKPDTDTSIFSKEKLSDIVAQRASLDTETPAIVNIRHKNGHTIPASLRIGCEIFQDTPIIFASILDERPRLESEKAKAFLSSIVTSCNDAIISKSLDGIITQCNESAEQLFAFSREELVGQAIYKIVPEDLIEQEERLMERLSQGKKVSNFETQRKTKAGDTFPVKVTLSPILDSSGQIIGASSITQDISLQKAQEEQLKQNYEALKESNENLEQFAFIASHDLKEPLRKILSFGELLKEESKEMSDESREYLGYITGAAERMRELLQCLLDYSRITSRGKPLRPTNLNEVLDNVLNDLEIAVDEKHARIEMDALPTVNGDDVQLRQLFQNLISNSLKYSRKDCPPLIKIYSQRNQNGAWSVTIEDNGIGFDPQYTQQIFQIFKRLHSRRDYEGTGIGLAICRKIAVRHGGDIFATSQPQQGSSFTVLLPPANNEESSE